MDWKWTITAVLPVLTLVLGAWLTQLSEGRREAAALKREELLRQLDRQQALVDRRETFELTNLTEVNELLYEVFTTAAQRYERIEAGEEAGWLSEGSDRTISDEARRMDKIRGLIIDDEIRRLVATAFTEADRLNYGPGEGEPYTRISRAYAHLDIAQSAIAERIREIYVTATHPRRSLRP